MSPSALPIPVREAAGRVLWSRLLDDPPQAPVTDDDPETDEQDDEERPDEAT